MKILPILLINNTVEELPIIIYDCEKIIIERLTCLHPGRPDISSCTLHFGETSLSYARVGSAFRRSVFYIDGVRDNFRSFRIQSPCNLQFKLSCTLQPGEPVAAEELRFLLHLSLELKSSGTRKLEEQDA